MKKIYLSVLRDRFSELMANHYPEYSKVTLKRSHGYSGSLCFSKRIDDCVLSVFVAPDPKGYDRFGLSIGWSRDGEEADSIERCIDFIEDDALNSAESVFWIPRVDDNREDSDWIIESELFPRPHQSSGELLTPKLAREVVAPMAEEAFSRFVEKGCPVLQRVVERWRSSGL